MGEVDEYSRRLPTNYTKVAACQASRTLPKQQCFKGYTTHVVAQQHLPVRLIDYISALRCPAMYARLTHVCTAQH